MSEDQLDEGRRLLQDWLDAEAELKAMVPAAANLSAGEVPSIRSIDRDYLAEWDRRKAAADRAHDAYRQWWKDRSP